MIAGQVTLAAIKAEVARRFDVSELALDSQRRHPSIAIPRHVVMYLGRELTHHSFPEIARRLGRRDHTTIMHGCRRTEQRMRENVEFTAVVEQIRLKLMAPRPEVVPIQETTVYRALQIALRVQTRGGGPLQAIEAVGGSWAAGPPDWDDALFVVATRLRSRRASEIDAAAVDAVTPNAEVEPPPADSEPPTPTAPPAFVRPPRQLATPVSREEAMKDRTDLRSAMAGGGRAVRHSAAPRSI